MDLPAKNADGLVNQTFIATDNIKKNETTQQRTDISETDAKEKVIATKDADAGTATTTTTTTTTTTATNTATATTTTNTTTTATNPKETEPILSSSSGLGKKSILEDHGYRVGKQIGTGTYAKVKAAYSEDLQATVAIKIISKMRAPPEYLRKFLPREIEVIKGLRHSNLIRFYQSIESSHRFYIVMQYCENGSLLDLIRKEGFLDEHKARKFFHQLISVIDYCHTQGVVHRDIKCENLLFDKENNLKLIDFGFARRFPTTPNASLSETYCGSYAYASPEVLRGIPYDPYLSDIWACGVVLFAMVYGRLPFDGSKYNQLIKQVQSKVNFPKQPLVSNLCKNLISQILSPLKIRLRMVQIKRDPWFMEKHPPPALK